MLDKIKEDLITKESDIFCKFIIEKIKQKQYAFNAIMKRDEVLYTITRHIKRQYAEEVMSKLEALGYIRTIDKQNIEILV